MTNEVDTCRRFVVPPTLAEVKAIDRTSGDDLQQIQDTASYGRAGG
jgi:hypothetical protein